MEVSHGVRAQIPDRRLFLTAAILFAAIVIVGFGRTYYLKGLFATPPLPSLLVHVHGITMTAWVALFVTQVFLVRSRKVDLHRRLGVAGGGLAGLVVVIGFLTAVTAAADGSASFPPNVPPLAFLAIPLFDLVMMVGLVGAAVYFRRQPANHKRLMLLAAINLLPPAFARFPSASLVSLGPLFFFGVPTVLVLIALGYDRWRSGTLNRAFAVGAFLLIASYPVRLVLSGTDAWMRFATWLTTFGAL